MGSIFILLHFEYKCNNTNIAYEMPFFKELRKFSQSNELKINELLEKKIDVTNDIFKEYNSTFIAKNAQIITLKNIPKTKNLTQKS